MRKGLKNMDGCRTKFIGTFYRYGTKRNWHGFPEPTILLKDIKQGNKIVTDHCWFKLTKGFDKLGVLTEGDLICFEARVTEYTKGYVNYNEGIDNREIDYRLSHPSKLSKSSSLKENNLFNVR